jgi:hypothetical protein
MVNNLWLSGHPMPGIYVMPLRNNRCVYDTTVAYFKTETGEEIKMQ